MIDTTPSPRSPALRWLPWTGLLLTILGPFAYAALLDHALLRSTGLIAWLLMALGVGVGLYCARRTPRRLTYTLAGLEVAMVGLFVFLFFVASKVPTTTGTTLAQAPDFTLNDQEGRPFTLSAELAQGPVLLVFYRGHW